MIHSLSYEVTFPSTGKVLSGSHTFHTGMTAITGPNGRGKSFLIEMIEFSLFGSKALRGQAADYRGLSAELSWDAYVVTRNGSKALLTRDGTEIAVGTTSVNAKIIEILGFNLEVFRIACSIKQGDIAALSNMLPTERKKMIDQVSGLEFLVELGKWCAEQAKDEGMRADALNDALVKPVEPVKPEGYQESATLVVQVAALDELVKEMHQLKGWLSVTRAEPKVPCQPPFEESVELLQTMVDQRNKVVAERAAIQASIARLPPKPKVALPEDAEAQLDAWDRWQERERFCQNYSRPSFTSAELDAAELKQKIMCRNDLLEQIENHVSRCPACGFEQPDSYIEKLRAKVAALGDLPAELEGVQYISGIQIHTERGLLKLWQEVAPIWDRLKDIPRATQPKFTRKDLDNARFEEERTELDLRLRQMDWMLRTVADRTQDLRTRQRYEDELARYAVAVTEYEAWMEELVAKEVRYAALKDETVNLPILKQHLEAARVYERDLASYWKLHQVYEIKHHEIGKLYDSQMHWRNAKIALDTLRTKVKSYLVPSLSRVASSLLFKMTGGKRSSIDVTDDFDLFVDGQPVRTLSGAEKAIANIALRIALGQILTCRVFPFLAMDEFDEALDESWSESTAEAIRSLTSNIAQIFVVSHKDPISDHSIRF